MTIDEANALRDKLKQISVDYQFNNERNARAALRKEYNDIWSSIVSAGFKIKINKVWSESRGSFTRELVISENRHKDAIAIVDNRSANATRRGDCTTRAICFCTGLDYDSVQREQLRLSSLSGYAWNNVRVWGKILFRHGYNEISLPRKVSRATFIRLFSNHGLDSGIIATLSSGHIAAIDMAQKKVLDTWDSSGGRIYRIYVPGSAYSIWKQKINAILG